MARPTTATIDLDAIRHNYRLAKQLAGESRALAVVKADAYGHGAVKVCQALVNEADGFAVAAIEEAIELREAGITSPILLLEGFFEANELSLIEHYNLSFVVHNSFQLESLAGYNGPAMFNVWLKIDIGMHRLGIPLNQALNALGQLLALRSVKNVVLMAHFACADELDNPITADQLQLFLKTVNGRGLPLSLSNSAAILGWPQTHHDWIRPGLMLYGATPFETAQAQADRLKPAMHLNTEVIAVRTLTEGETVGYGASWRAERPSRIGTLAIGYADGYPRQMRSGAPILIEGQRTNIVGRVSMDMITVDLTDLPKATIGSSAELFGAALTAAELAPWANTIPYTLFTGITRRVHKVYSG